MIKKKFNNETITQTVLSDDIYSGLSFGTIQADYPLSAADFMRLKSGWVSVFGWALNTGFAVFGYALSIFPKMVSGFLGGTEVVSKGEWLVLIFGGMTVFLLCVVGFFLPSEKKELMKEIKEHFKKSPKTRHPLRGSHDQA